MSSKQSEIRVRIAPSPTGLLHIGTVRAALFNYLFAKHNKGTFIIRIEDTDKERSSSDYEKDILMGLEKLMLSADEGPEIGGEFGPYRQSERRELHKTYLLELIQQGHAYFCFCDKEQLDAEKKASEQAGKPPRYAGHCKGIPLEEAWKRMENGEKYVVRFNLPDNDITYEDLIRGKQSFKAKDFDDFIIAKNIETPLYNFVVVIDDHLMNISHVIRGEDHISNTPKQMWMYQSFGWDMPQFAHLPLVLNADRSKLSKRYNKVSVNDYLDEGYLPEALINFLALLGWNTSDEKEIFSMSELIEQFSLDRVQKAGAIFDMQRLNWINCMHIRALSTEDLLKKVLPFWRTAVWFHEKTDRSWLLRIVEQLKERLTKLSEITELTHYFFQSPVYEKELLIGKKMDEDIARKALMETERTLNTQDDFSEDSLKETLFELRDTLELKTGQLLWPIRAALSGEAGSPGAFELLSIFGKEESLVRLNIAIEKLK